jgi:hypothetical protein
MNGFSVAQPELFFLFPSSLPQPTIIFISNENLNLKFSPTPLLPGRRWNALILIIIIIIEKQTKQKKRLLDINLKLTYSSPGSAWETF